MLRTLTSSTTAIRAEHTDFVTAAISTAPPLTEAETAMAATGIATQRDSVAPYFLRMAFTAAIPRPPKIRPKELRRYALLITAKLPAS